MAETAREDALLGGRVRLRQPATGYRVAIDPVLLAAACPAVPGESVLDVGCGVGAAALCLLARVPGLAATGLELQPALAALARENAALDAALGHLAVVEADIAAPPSGWPAPRFDHVLSNPPFHPPGRSRPSPDAARALATAGPAPGLARWLAFCLACLAPHGRLTAILRADRLDEALAALAGQAGAVEVIPLWPKAGRPAKRVVLRARKGARTPLALLPGLTLHRPDGRFTEDAEAILRDGAGLALHAPPAARERGEAPGGAGR